MIEVVDVVSVGLELRVLGLVTREDYGRVLPLAKHIVRARGSFSAVVDITEARGLTLGAIWEDAKFDVTAFRKTDRIAYVGKRGMWWLWPTSWPFARGGVRFFAAGEAEAARAWAFVAMESSSGRS